MIFGYLLHLKNHFPRLGWYKSPSAISTALITAHDVSPLHDPIFRAVTSFRGYKSRARPICITWNLRMWKICNWHNFRQHSVVFWSCLWSKELYHCHQCWVSDQHQNAFTFRCMYVSISHNVVSSVVLFRIYTTGYTGSWLAKSTLLYNIYNIPSLILGQACDRRCMIGQCQVVQLPKSREPNVPREKEQDRRSRLSGPVGSLKITCLTQLKQPPSRLNQKRRRPWVMSSWKSTFL